MSSKLMQVVSANDFNQKLEKGGVNVRAYSVHPGLVKTELHRANLGTSIVSFLLGVFYKVRNKSEYKMKLEKKLLLRNCGQLWVISESRTRGRHRYVRSNKQ